MFVRTRTGTYQFVGSIQAERSPTKTTVLCERNQDPESDEEWLCNRGEVCVEGTFCSADVDNDNEADDPNTPVEGYFYKITWGVTAPQDEKQTPYIDENGKAVKFNIQLSGPGGQVWLYQRPGETPTAILALNNGQGDSDVITHYSPQAFVEACIRYDPRHTVTDGTGDSVGDQCVPIIFNQKGSVEYSASGRTPSVTTQSTQVSQNRDW